MTTEEEQRLLENAFYEVQELLMERDAKITDADTEAGTLEGVDLLAGAKQYVSTYNGHNDFIIKLQRDHAKFGKLSHRQSRAALNILADELKKGTTQFASKKNRAAPISTIKVHNPIEPEEGDVAVVKAGEKTLLDISGIPDGRYAYMDPSGRHDFVFLMVRTIKKETFLDRAYRWSKFRTGRERIYPGTILVREWSQDAKRLVGYQKVGEGYHGEYSDQLIEIMRAPKVWALIFAKYIGRCAICGKTLTDELSREDGIGPECKQKYGMEYWSKFVRKTPTPSAP